MNPFSVSTSRLCSAQKSNQIRLAQQLTLTRAQSLPASVGSPATIDREGLAVDKAALGRVGEEKNGAGDVVGTGEAGHRDAPGDVLVGVAAAGLVGDIHLCFHPTGADGVDANATPAPLSRKGAGKTYEAVLGGIVGGAVADADQTGN